MIHINQLLAYFVPWIFQNVLNGEAKPTAKVKIQSQSYIL